MMKRFADKKTKHRLRHIIISDDAILYRPLQRNILRRLVVMNERLRAKAQYMAVDVIHRDRTRFSKDHFIFLCGRNNDCLADYRCWDDLFGGNL